MSKSEPADGFKYSHTDKESTGSFPGATTQTTSSSSYQPLTKISIDSGSKSSEQLSYSRAQRNASGGWDVIICREGERQQLGRYPTKFEAAKAITEFERMEIKVASSKPYQPLDSGFSSGIKGIHRSGDKWVAQCFKDGGWHYLGRHTSREEAAEAIVNFEDSEDSGELATPPPINFKTTVPMMGTIPTALNKTLNFSSYPPPRAFVKPPLHAVIRTGKRGRPAKLINRPIYPDTSQDSTLPYPPTGQLGASFATTSRTVTPEVKSAAMRGKKAKDDSRTPSGVKGVYRHKDRWSSQATYNGSRHYLGVFPTIEIAGMAARYYEKYGKHIPKENYENLEQNHAQLAQDPNEGDEQQEQEQEQDSEQEQDWESLAPSDKDSSSNFEGIEEVEGVDAQEKANFGSDDSLKEERESANEESAGSDDADEAAAGGEAVSAKKAEQNAKELKGAEAQDATGTEDDEADTDEDGDVLDAQVEDPEKGSRKWSARVKHINSAGIDAWLEVGVFAKLADAAYAIHLVKKALSLNDGLDADGDRGVDNDEVSDAGGVFRFGRFWRVLLIYDGENDPSSNLVLNLGLWNTKPEARKALLTFQRQIADGGMFRLSKKDIEAGVLSSMRSKVNTPSGVIGVTPKYGKWQARSKLQGKQHAYLGYHDTVIGAAMAIAEHEKHSLLSDSVPERNRQILKSKAISVAEAASANEADSKHSIGIYPNITYSAKQGKWDVLSSPLGSSAANNSRSIGSCTTLQHAISLLAKHEHANRPVENPAPGEVIPALDDADLSPVPFTLSASQISAWSSIKAASSAGAPTASSAAKSKGAASSGVLGKKKKAADSNEEDDSEEEEPERASKKHRVQDASRSELAREQRKELPDSASAHTAKKAKAAAEPGPSSSSSSSSAGDTIAKGKDSKKPPRSR